MPTTATSSENLQLITVTPEMATEWLDKMGANRKLNMSHADRLAEDIKRGDWHQTGDPIRFDRKGNLVDGQHRLQAIINSGRAVELYVARNLDSKAMAVIDTGKARSIADVFQIRGVENGRKLAAAIKQIFYLDNDRMASSGPAISQMQADRTLKAHPYLPDAVAKVVEAPAIQPHAQLAAVYCVAHEKHPRKADQWLAAVQKGESLRSGHPVYVLREKLLDMRGTGSTTQMRGPAVAAMMVRSWIFFNAGELKGITLRQLMWRTTKATAEEPFPGIE